MTYTQLPSRVVYYSQVTEDNTPPFGHPSKEGNNSPSVKGWQAKPDGVVKMIRLLSTFILGSFLAVTAAPVYSAFEQMESGARPIGMGGAFTAVADDAYAIHYNPAGLAQVRRMEFTSGYGKLYSGLKDNSNLGNWFVGMVQPLKLGSYGSLGISWFSLNLVNAYREDTLNFSYGKEYLISGLFWGGSCKVLKRSFDRDIYTQVDSIFTKEGYDTTNFSLDFGMIYRPAPSYSFALAFKDMTQPNVGLSASDTVSLEIRGGFAYRQPTLILDAELSRKDKDTYVVLGLEKRLMRAFALRAGIGGGNRNRREISAGLGYNLKNFNIDYAFIARLGGIESTAGNHRFSFTVCFGKEPSERAAWEFEEDSQVIEQLLREKNERISEMERELEELQDENRSGKIESNWVRERIIKLEDRIHKQEASEIQQMKDKISESKVENEGVKQQMLDLERRIKHLFKNTQKAVQSSEKIKKLPEVPRAYQVQEGETLQSIAEKFYGDSSKWMEIYKLNSDRIERGGTLTAGQVLLMPQP